MNTARRIVTVADVAARPMEKPSTKKAARDLLASISSQARQQRDRLVTERTDLLSQVSEYDVLIKKLDILVSDDAHVPASTPLARPAERTMESCIIEAVRAGNNTSGKIVAYVAANSAFRASNARTTLYSMARRGTVTPVGNTILRTYALPA